MLRSFGKSRWLLRCAVALVLAMLMELFICWGLPNLEEKKASNTRPGSPYNMFTPYDIFWTDGVRDGVRGGHYILHDRPFISHISFQRILFVGAAKDQAYYMKNPPPAWAATISLDMHEGFEQVDTVAVGWPFRCFRAEHWIAWTPRQAPVQPLGNLLGATQQPPPPPMEEFRGGYRHVLQNGDSAFFAYQPMWIGLLGNLAIFGAGCFLVSMTISKIRRSRRRKRLLCAECGYSLEGVVGERCPECAAPLQKQPRPAS